MPLMRTLLLAASRSVWMRERATRYPFVRRAVSRFMPGETLEEALAASALLQARGIPGVITCLGENVRNQEEAAAVAGHYLDALQRIREKALDVEISLKLTHMGLDLGPDVAATNVARIARRAAETGARVWIDMEDSSYTDRTLQLYRRLRPEFPGLGVCLQSYLRRTRADLASLLPLAPAIRLVKGAYKEPPEVAFPRKQEVDESFFDLGVTLLGGEARGRGAWTVIGTHDPALIGRLVRHAEDHGVPKEAYEFALLYGIRRDQQDRLAAEGRRVRVLISYGGYWFPWYMRRLAERPANLWFVARSIVSK